MGYSSKHYVLEKCERYAKTFAELNRLAISAD